MKKLRTGDVFTVPIDDATFGIGQVVATYDKGGYFLAIFDTVVQRPVQVDLEAATTEAVLFLTLSLDAKIAAGHWEVIGHAPVSPKIPLPAYKEAVGRPDRIDIVDYTGNIRRPANSDEAEKLPNRSIVAPVRLEKALKAKHGLEPWNDAYDRLIPNEETTTARMFSHKD